MLGPRLVKRFQRLRQLHLHKWGITRLPDASLWPESDLMLTSKRLDRWYELQRDEDPAFTTRAYPVFMTRVRQGENPESSLIEFNVDTSLPIDLILGFLDKELRSWYWKTFGPHGRGKPASIDLQLAVYDFVCGSEKERPRTFKEAVRTLRKPVSTIRDAYFVARTKIGIAEKVQPSSSSQSIADPGSISQCTNERCRNAKTPEDFCKPHRRYIGKDYSSQKDQIVDDLSAIEHGRARSARSRKNHGSESIGSDD